MVVRDLFCRTLASQLAEDLEIGDIYHYRKRLIFYTVLLTVWIIIGSIIVRSNEKWTWIQAFYFIIETSSVSLI